jgi:glutamate-1-semialdehyde 2,1-aminomutase
VGIDRDRLQAFAEAERARFAAARPVSAALAAKATGAEAGFWGGVPQHWMVDWPTPFPLVIQTARGCELVDADGHALVDLCLGDTGAMFGHGPEPVARALSEAAESGFTTMLPSPEAGRAGRLLREIFGLPHWQTTLTASDANRFALRVARAVTGRPKVLVFDGCYHGAVEEAGVMLDAEGRMAPKPSLWGQAIDLDAIARCAPFNDLDAVARALAHGDVACVMTEPALTNCGIVPPAPGFLEGLRALTREAGALLLIDETHTLSEGRGGWTRAHGLEPDLFVAGKAVAGGVPCGVWGFTEAVRAGLDAARARLPGGHSGVGTTLSGGALQMRALAACLSEVMTAEAYARMIAGAVALEEAIGTAIARFGLSWTVVRLGARLETVFSAEVPRDARAMRATFDPALERALHLGLINRGFLVTPFHNMLLAGPELPGDAPRRYGEALSDILSQIV